MISTSDKTMNYRADIERRLRKLFLKEILLSSYSAIIKIMGFWGGALLLGEFLEMIFRFDSLVRTVLFWSFIVLLGVLTIYLFGKKILFEKGILKGINYYRLAETVGEKFPQIKDELENALQILDAETEGTSSELAEAAFENVYEKSKRLDFSKATVFKHSPKDFILLGLFLFQIVITSIIPSFQAARMRLIHYRQEFKPPLKFHFIVEPGNVSVTKGNDLTISIKIKGEQQERIFLKKKSRGDYRFVPFELKPDSNGVFKKSFYSVETPFRYFAESDGIASDTFTVEVINRPMIIALTLKAVPPRYSKLPVTIQKDNGNFSGLPGTLLEFSLISSKALDSAFVIVNGKRVIRAKIEGEKAYAKIKALKDFSYHFRIIDTNGIENANPIEYSVKLLKDAFPTIEVIEPSKDVKLGSENLLTVVTDISDDFGFSSLTLFYRLSQSEFKNTQESFSEIPIPFDVSKKEQEVFYNWNLFPLNLTENDVVSYYLEIKDNDNINGPKGTKSEIRTLRVPSLDELFQEAENTQATSKRDLQETFREAEKLKEEMQNLSEELRKNKKKISWEEKQKIEQAAKRFEGLQKKAKSIAEQLKKMQKELQKNNLLSKETLKKYEELQKLFDELTSEDLKKAFEKMQKMLQSMMRDKAQTALENLKFDEEAFKKSLERTINLLKRIEIEQKLDELLKRTEKLVKEQKALADSTKKGKADKEMLKRRQRSIKKGVKKLKEEAKKLAEKMKELKDMPAKEMEKALKEFSKQNNEKLIEKAEAEIQQGKFSRASQTQCHVAQNLSRMQKAFSQIQNSVRMKNQMEVMAKMLQLTNNLLELSKKEESLKNSTANLSPQSLALSEKAREQNKIAEDLERLISQITELSQKTFAITPEMGRALGGARAKMRSAISAMQDRNSSLAVISEKAAMKFLNETASLMQSSMSQMMKPGGGMMSLMQQLQKLTGQQMSLNKLTKMLKGGLSPQQLAQMQKLARQQEAIRKSLEELDKEFKKSGQSKKLTGNLERILKDMREVISDLKSKNVDDNLIHKQERILSRLLDAQRSINERDFEKRRESRSGKQFSLKSPPELMLQTREGRNKLRDALLKALSEGYSKDYEDLIRKYFEELEKQKSKDSLR